MTMDYDCWSAEKGAPVVCATGGDGNENLSTWAANFSPQLEVHGLINVNPDFTSESSGNFQPATGSPLRGATAQRGTSPAHG